MFTIEVPLGELVKWNRVRGVDLTARTAGNTLRYLELPYWDIYTVISSMDECGADGWGR